MSIAGTFVAGYGTNNVGMQAFIPEIAMRGEKGAQVVSA
jgi:hypothetical protein